MSVPSSAPRVTAPTSSQTPVTASVVKFRCLFTHDLRRKSKRWQDGYLRYHAFNKRVMVYDEHGNYIGDHHWRAAEEVQDGDELELDKGVLIEVGERMSTTQQDLTNLFEKKRSSQASPGTPSHYRDSQPSQPPRPTPTPVRATGGSSQSFRSLNDLLGIKRTPIGHLVSPYEERHPPPTPSLPGSSARPPKRPRVSAENPPGRSRNVPAEVVDLTESEQRQTAPPSPPAREVVRRQQDTRPNPPITPLEKPKPKPKETPRIPNPPSNPASTLAKPSLPLPSETRPRPPNSTAHTAREDASVEPSKHRDLPNNDISRPSRPNNDQEPPKKPGNVLRMAKEKPRRKLMYNALLPTSSSSDGFQKSSSVSSMGPPMGPPSKRSHPASNPSPKKSEPTSVLTQDPTSTNTEFIPSVSTQSILEEMAGNPGCGSDKGGSQPAPRNLPAKRSLDAPLRKSLSDPTAFTGSPSLQARPTIMRSALSTTSEQAEETENEQGPWTSEALDLFDFWPPGRPKPY